MNQLMLSIVYVGKFLTDMRISNIVFKKSYIQYYKEILHRVSFCRILFRKEYLKAKRTLTPCEFPQLVSWVRENKFIY